MNSQRVTNAVYLSALGDGWGYTTEFTSFGSIPREVPIPNPVRISDDTQMAIAVIQGIEKSRSTTDSELLAIGDAFLIWADDVDNNRAPGNTCMSALSQFGRTRELANPFSGTILASKGCGANMRAGWLGFLDRPIEDIEQLASDQAKITHGHPTALESSALTTHAVWAIAHDEVEHGGLVEYLLGRAEDSAVIEALVHARDTAADYVRNLDNDPCWTIGEGWIAEEALALAAKVFDVYDNPAEGLLRSVRTGGDSDSIACIAGSFMGASLDTDWRELFEGDIRFEPRYERELADVLSVLA